MNSIKCKHCGLQNFTSATECRRCGSSFARAPKREGKRPPRFSIWSLVMIAGFAGLVYYFYTGIEHSIEEVDAIERQRVARQPASQPSPGLSRSQAEQQRAGTYADAVKNSPSLNAHQKRVEDTEKAVQQSSNSASR